MRYVPGFNPKVANESITSHMLVNHIISEPDILPGVTKLWRNEITPFSSMLADRNMFSSGLGKGFSSSQYKVVSQNHVQYAIESSDRVVVRLVNGPGGTPFVCDPYPTTPGKNQSVVTIYVDTDWLSPKDVFEFADNQTLGHIFDERLPEMTSTGAYALKIKVVSGSRDSYIDTFLLSSMTSLKLLMRNILLTDGVMLT